MSIAPLQPSFPRTVTVTFLEMTARSVPRLAPQPRPHLRVIRAEHCSVSFYRYLYDAVGSPWYWVDRKRLSDPALAAIIQNPAVEIYVLYQAGVPAGYAELDRVSRPNVDLSYFGIMPEFIGQSLGPWFLQWTIAQAWAGGAERLTVNTCTLDHPAALPLYQRLGFVPYFERETQFDPTL